MGMDRTLFSTPEGVDRESYIIATYPVEHDSTVDILRTAAALDLWGIHDQSRDRLLFDLK